MASAEELGRVQLLSDGAWVYKITLAPPLHVCEYTSTVCN